MVRYDDLIDVININKFTNINKILKFIKVFLNIKSEIVLMNKQPIFNHESKTHTMASVSYPINGVYTININFDDTKCGIVRRLAHECVHVKQIEDGRLKYIGKNKFSFDNIEMSFTDYVSNYHNNNIPKFEEEAFTMECEIANAYWKTKLD